MYATSLRKELVAQHYLPNAVGREAEWHSHPYKLEVTVYGEELDRNGYLVDLDEMDRAMDGLTERYGDSTLNEHPDFQGLNPSIENFAKVCWERLVASMDTSSISEMEVRIYETDLAYAAYQGKVGD
ncbi:MAG: 6-pyruvoyl trahydropterin synthase family protein [Methanomassiliicoccales archaeon]